MAERKVNSCLPPNHPLDREPDIERICGAGVDPAFDKLIGSLGYIARHKPKPVIDSLMIWRKSKSDAAAFSRGTGQDTPRGHQMLPRRNTEPVPMDGNTPRESSLVADRRTTVAIYILCRVLIEVIGQTTLDRVTEDMQRLEEIIFNQLRSADPDVLATSPLRHANWTLFSQLLGVMSSIDFVPVTDQFFQALEQAKSSAPATREQEAKTALIVRGMSYIKLKVHLRPLHAGCIHLHFVCSSSQKMSWKSASILWFHLQSSSTMPMAFSSRQRIARYSANYSCQLLPQPLPNSITRYGRNS